jgi:hypothetical protein
METHKIIVIKGEELGEKPPSLRMKIAKTNENLGQAIK